MEDYGAQAPLMLLHPGSARRRVQAAPHCDCGENGSVQARGNASSRQRSSPDDDVWATVAKEMVGHPTRIVPSSLRRRAEYTANGRGTAPGKDVHGLLTR